MLDLYWSILSFFFSFFLSFFLSLFLSLFLSFFLSLFLSLSLSFFLSFFLLFQIAPKTWSDWSPSSLKDADCLLGYKEIHRTRDCIRRPLIPSPFEQCPEKETWKEDCNECTKKNGGCAHHCKNFDGGFSCSCNDGYKLINGNNCKSMFIVFNKSFKNSRALIG